MKDLIVLVADLDTENVLLGLLPRLVHIIGTREFTFDIKRHPYRDSGCTTGSADFLRPLANQYRNALVVFDKEGSGSEAKTREEIETSVESELVKNGWPEGHVSVIAIDPEVENWMWINTPRVGRALNWKDDQALYDWLRENEWLEDGATKPARPKEAMEAVLKKNKKPRSASIYKEIAENVSFRGCTDEAFLKMLDNFLTWFTPPLPMLFDEP